MYNLLLITGDLNFTNGVTTHLFNLIIELEKHKEINITLLCTGGDSIERFKALKISIIQDDNFEHDKRNVKNFYIAVKSLIKIIRKNKIDIVHSHNHYAANISHYASRLTGVKTIQTNHGLIPEGGILKHFKAHKIITVNEQIEKYLVKNKIVKKEKITSINQGFQYNGDIIKSKDEIKIICASRLIHEKGADIFIRAAKIVTFKKKAGIKFLIAGEGEYEDELKKLSKELDTKITFAGKITDLPGLLSQTNIFVMSSRSMSEGFPMTIVEAALTKNFIIASGLDPVKGIFRNGIDGFTFKTGDHQDLAQKIMIAIDEPEETTRMTDSFFRRSKKLFDPVAKADKHTALYKKCLET
ncbi:MAG: glycosyltransferase family 4 protein [Ignavibacteria bacterium]